LRRSASISCAPYISPEASPAEIRIRTEGIVTAFRFVQAPSCYLCAFIETIPKAVSVANSNHCGLTKNDMAAGFSPQRLKPTLKPLY